MYPLRVPLEEEATRESFARICERVCEEQRWKLLPTGVELRWPDGRHQLVSLEFRDFDGEDLVCFSTVVGDARVLPPGRLMLALQANARFPHGALAVRDDQLIMRDTFLLADVDAAQIRASIAYLARTADDYERIFFQTDEH